LIATDAISEGYNLHRAGTIFNYDIPYNPTRVIQRLGRINRINKKVFDELFVYNFFPTTTGEKEIRSCLNCLKPVIEPKKFCNSKCCGQYVKKETFKNIKNNNLENISDPRVKEFLIKKYGVKCQICNTSEWLGRPIPLVLDHIDGDHENRDIKNYRLVCGNCDMLLPTYKGKNKGHGRFSRRERYKQGKSY